MNSGSYLTEKVLQDKRVMPPSRRNSITKPAVATNTKEIERHRRGRRPLNNGPIQEHTKVMREAKRLREQIRVRAVNAEYTHLNHTLGLKNECPSLPKISKQQTLKTCISHIKKLREELSMLSGNPQVQTSFSQEEDVPMKRVRDSPPMPIPESHPQMYIPSFPMYMPNIYPLPPLSSELDGYSSMDAHNFSSDDVTHYGPFQYPYPGTDTDYESMIMPGPYEDDGSGSDLQNASETFSSELLTDFPAYSDSFCSTPDTPSSPYSWFLPSQWSNLEDN